MIIHPDDEIVIDREWLDESVEVWNYTTAKTIISNPLNNSIRYKMSSHFDRGTHFDRGICYMEVELRATNYWMEVVTRRYHMCKHMAQWAISNYDNDILQPNIYCPTCGRMYTIEQYLGDDTLIIPCEDCVTDDYYTCIPQETSQKINWVSEGF